MKMLGGLVDSDAGKTDSRDDAINRPQDDLIDQHYQGGW